MLRILGLGGVDASSTSSTNKTNKGSLVLLRMAWPRILPAPRPVRLLPARRVTQVSERLEGASAFQEEVSGRGKCERQPGI